jgi:FkbM family methyltransferase
MLVVDVGANRGSFSNHVLSLGLGIDVLAIEPNPSCRETLQALAEQFVSNFKWISGALVTTEMDIGEVLIYGSELFGGHVASVFPLNRSYQGNEFLEEEISKSLDLPLLSKAYTVESLKQVIGDQTIDFLKLDAQGLDVLLLEEFLEHFCCEAGVLEVTVSSDQSRDLYVTEKQGSSELVRVCLLLSEEGFDVLRINPAESTCREFNLFFVKKNSSFNPIDHFNLNTCEVFSRYWNIGQREGTRRTNMDKIWRYAKKCISTPYKLVSRF